MSDRIDAIPVVESLDAPNDDQVREHRIMRRLERAVTDHEFALAVEQVVEAKVGRARSGRVDD